MRVAAEPEEEQEQPGTNTSPNEATADTHSRRRWFGQTESPVAWFVAINAMLQLAIFAAEMSTFGIYYVALCEYFDEPKATVGWVRGIQTITGSTFGKDFCSAFTLVLNVHCIVFSNIHYYL